MEKIFICIFIYDEFILLIFKKRKIILIISSIDKIQYRIKYKLIALLIEIVILSFLISNSII